VVQAAKQAAPVGGGGDVDLNEPTLAHKVESEIFRDEDAPKDRVDVNVEGDVVYLRGELDDEARIEALVNAAEQVDGVGRVESLLHTPGTPAPTKA
jgi:osmotically-inducible protein OsmY